MSSDEADNQWTVAQKIGRRHLQVILIDSAESRSVIPDLQGTLFDSRSLEYGCGTVHELDCFVWCVIGRSPRLKRFLEFIQAFLKIWHCFPRLQRETEG